MAEQQWLPRRGKGHHVEAELETYRGKREVGRVSLQANSIR